MKAWISIESSDDLEYGMNANKKSIRLFSGVTEEAHQKWINHIKEDFSLERNPSMNQSGPLPEKLYNWFYRKEKIEIPEDFWNIPKEGYQRIFNIKTNLILYSPIIEKIDPGFNTNLVHILEKGIFKIGVLGGREYQNVIEFYLSNKF